MIVKNEYLKNEYLNDEHYSTSLERHISAIGNEKKYEFELPNYYLNNKKVDYFKLSESTFEIKFNFNDTNNCEFTGIGSETKYTGNFNFNGGSFTFEGRNFTITSIAKKVFHHTTGSSYTDFYETNLTIPSTIQSIGDEAFYNNSRIAGRKEIIGLNFEEGIKSIGKSAFEKCKDISQDTLKLPNSLEYIGNRAFVNTGALKYFDLTALDHVIDIDCNPLSKNGCLPTHQIKKIYFKDEATKNLYLKDKYWKSCARYFEVK